MVFSDDVCSDSQQGSPDSRTSAKDVDSETDGASTGSTSPRLPSPPPTTTRGRRELRQGRHKGQGQVGESMVGERMVVTADPAADTVIVVSRDRRTGKREHIMLRSLLKTRGAPGRIEKRVVVSRG